MRATKVVGLTLFDLPRLGKVRPLQALKGMLAHPMRLAGG